MSSLTTRPLRPADEELLRIATLDNLNWVGERFTMEDVVERPEFAKYATLNVSRGDFGIAAEREGEATGAAWALFLPEDDAGYGFVDAQIPQLSLWVHEDERGQGLGRLLLRLLVGEARRRNVGAVSLSVEEGNFAKVLYASEGFRDLPGREAEGVMIWRIDT